MLLRQHFKIKYCRITGRTGLSNGRITESLLFTITINYHAKAILISYYDSYFFPRRCILKIFTMFRVARVSLRFVYAETSSSFRNNYSKSNFITIVPTQTYTRDL
jgi:hypothetical protein